MSSISRTFSSVHDSISELVDDIVEFVDVQIKHIDDNFNYVVNSVDSSIKSAISSVVVSNKVVVNDRYASGKRYWKAFTTSTKARQFRSHYNFDIFDENEETVELTIPKNISQMTISWFVNVMYPSYYKLGEKAFTKYKWKIIRNDEAPDNYRVLKDQIKMGIEHCRELKSNNFDPKSWLDESESSGRKYSFDSINSIDLFWDSIQPAIQRVKTALVDFGKKAAYTLTTWEYYSIALNATFIFVPIAAMMMFPYPGVMAISTITTAAIIFLVEGLRIHFVTL